MKIAEIKQIVAANPDAVFRVDGRFMGNRDAVIVGFVTEKVRYTSRTLPYVEIEYLFLGEDGEIKRSPYRERILPRFVSHESFGSPQMWAAAEQQSRAKREAEQERIRSEWERWDALTDDPATREAVRAAVAEQCAVEPGQVGFDWSMRMVNVRLSLDEIEAIMAARRAAA